MTDTLKDTFAPGDRVTMRFDDGSALTGTVVTPPREWTTQQGTPVVFDGDHYVTHSMTSRLEYVGQD